jgi:type II secretory pathway pseudopilin PulG
MTVKTSKRAGALRPGLASAFTLVECLAALAFLAIVIPVAVEAMHVASGAGEIAARKGEAARVAQQVLNESIVTTNWSAGQSVAVSQGSDDFRYTISSQDWQPGQSKPSPLKLLTAEVTFSVQGRDYTVKMSTLAAPRAQTQTTTTGMTP